MDVNIMDSINKLPDGRLSYPGTIRGDFFYDYSTDSCDNGII